MSGRGHGARLAVALALLLAMPLATSAPAGRKPSVGGKPAAPVAIRHALAGQPALGRALAVSIAVSSSVPLENVTLTLAADDGLALDVAAPVLRIARLEAGETYETTVSVTPLVIDVLDLAVIVAGDAGGAREARAALIPIRLAARKSRAPVALARDAASGGFVHALPGRARP